MKFKPDNIEVGQFQLARVHLLRTKEWVPVEKLFNPPRSGRGMSMFYPQSWLVTHYMMEGAVRRIKLTSFLQAIGRGEEAASAFQATFDMDFKAFDKVMKKCLARSDHHRNACLG